jgi:transketolase
MEGVASDAAALAAHLKLSNLCWIYDNNRVTIEGYTRLAFTEDVAARFLGYGWHVTRVSDANDLEMLARAYETFRTTSAAAAPSGMPPGMTCSRPTAGNILTSPIARHRHRS